MMMNQRLPLPGGIAPSVSEMEVISPSISAGKLRMAKCAGERRREKRAQGKREKKGDKWG